MGPDPREHLDEDHTHVRGRVKRKKSRSDHGPLILILVVWVIGEAVLALLRHWRSLSILSILGVIVLAVFLLLKWRRHRTPQVEDRGDQDGS